MEIRFAEPRDVAEILKLLKQTGQVHYKTRPDIFRPNAQRYGASQVLAMLESSKTPVFVAVEESRVLGCGFCQIREYRKDPVMADHRALLIDDLCVEETDRAQQVGSAIYEAILRYARMRKCYNVTLNVWSCNENAMQFYQAMGMKPQRVGLERILEEN